MSQRVSPKTETRTLKNGVVLATTPLFHLGRAALYVAVRLGSRYESPATSGLSHVLEHMLFRGTGPHPTSFEFNRAMEELGGTLSAATYADMTTYEISVPPTEVARAAELIVEMALSPRMNHFEIEKKVLREEILELLDDEGALVDADELLNLALFGSHPLGYPIVGSLTNLDNLELKTLESWHRQHYVGENIVVSVSGSFDPTLIDAVERAFEQLPRGVRSEALPFKKAEKGPRARHVDVYGSQTDVRVGIPTFGKLDPSHLALSLFARVLDDGMSARIFRTIVEDEGLAYDAFGGMTAYADAGALTLGAACVHDRVPQVLRSLIGVLSTLRHDGISDRELEKVRARALFDLDCARDQPEAMAELAAEEILFATGRTFEALEGSLQSLTRGEVEAAGAAVLRADGLQLVTAGTLDESTLDEVRAFAKTLKTFPQS